MARQTLDNNGGAIEAIHGTEPKHDQHLKRQVFEQFVAVTGPISIHPTIQNQPHP